jgi:PAS domain S-box-containing protein
VFDLRSFSLTDMLECSSGLRRLGSDASSMEGAALAVVRYLRIHLIDKQSEEPPLPLVRLYKTHRYDELEPELRSFAAAMSPGGVVVPDAPCLTLLASVGDEPEWNDRRLSRGHRAIPLQDAAALAASPMIYQLTRELGFEEGELVQPDRDLFHAAGDRPGRVFYVPDARGSPHVPAQAEFVERYGIRSVIGFGGALPSGYVFAVVIFSKIGITRETADAFATLAFATQLALLPFVERRLFDSDPPDDRVDPIRDLRMAEAEATALGHLLDTRHSIVTEQAARLEQARRQAEDRTDALIKSQRSLEASEATKSAILDAALDCIITMDFDGRVVDFNPAAQRTFGYSHGEAVGRLLSDLIVPARLRAEHQEGLDRYRRTGVGAILGQRIEISSVRADGTEFPVELTVTAVAAGGIQLFSGHVRDITDRIRVEQDLRTAGQRYAEIARILQASLLPPALPAIPGVELASVYRPGLEGFEVGGDFYDVFDLGDGRWGVVLGDVMGKGAEAAAITALARHTVRAAAIRTDQPTDVLRDLNQALFRADSERFCTAAFGFLDLNDRPRFSMSSGGHPPPLLRSATDVTPLAADGLILGPFREWTGTQVSIDLEPADLVLMYSDGVTEARRGSEQFGLERLQEALLGSCSAAVAETVERVVDAVGRFATAQTDDIALVAMRVI